MTIPRIPEDVYKAMDAARSRTEKRLGIELTFMELHIGENNPENLPILDKRFLVVRCLYYGSDNKKYEVAQMLDSMLLERRKDLCTN